MADATGDKVKGDLKQAGGDLTGDKDLKNEGRVDKASGNVKDAVNSVTDKAKRAIRLTTDYRIDGTPAMAVHGRYMVPAGDAMFDTVNKLVASVRKNSK